MKKDVSAFKVAATYIGTVIGAGFASGQEILQFFSIFGAMGFWGVIVVTLLFMLFGYIILEMGYLLNSKSHLEVIKTAGGKVTGRIIDYIITFFLFGGLTAMIAGCGAIFAQQFKLPSILGNAAMAIITVLTVLTGINGVINSISFIVPFLLISVVGVSIVSLFTVPAYISNTINSIINPANLTRNWLWAAILYTSYNTLMSVAVLAPIGAKAVSRRAIKTGAALGGLGLGIGALSIHLAILRNFNSVSDLEVPMAFIAGSISYTIQIIYSVVLIAEIYTTAVANLYGFSARITDTEKHGARSIITATCIFALIASMLGFSTLVKYLYPIVGYGGVLLLTCLLYTKFKLIINKEL